MTPEEKRARLIAKAIRLAWSSLRSHIPYTYGEGLVRNETYRFHQKCIQEYADIIKILATLY